MRHLIMLFASILVACSKEVPYDYGVASPMAPATYAQLSAIPSECSFTASAPHAFIAWGTLDADEYACSSFAGLTCALYVGAEHTEMECVSSGPTPPIPTGCTVAPSGMPTYDCGEWHSVLHCTYSSASERMTCKQLITHGGSTFWSVKE